jgi:hypothetical protein
MNKASHLKTCNQKGTSYIRIFYTSRFSTIAYNKKLHGYMLAK